MSGRIRIRFSEVYGRCAQLRTRASVEAREADRAYSQLRTQFMRLDGSANSALQMAVERNRQKTHALARIISRLTLFMDRSAGQVEQTDQRMQRSFGTISGIRR